MRQVQGLLAGRGQKLPSCSSATSEEIDLHGGFRSCFQWPRRHAVEAPPSPTRDARAVVTAEAADSVAWTSVSESAAHRDTMRPAWVAELFLFNHHVTVPDDEIASGYGSPSWTQTSTSAWCPGQFR